MPEQSRPEPVTPSHRPRRVRVVGNSGAGKTTFARALAARLDVPHLELDGIFWDAGWTMRDVEDAQRRLAALVAGPGREGWVACGNWANRIGSVLDDADTIVWLDYPRRVIMPRIIWRTVGRGLTRRELWHGNRERLTNLLRRDPEQNIVRWSWTQHDAYRERYRELAASAPRVVRLATPRAADRWLEGV